MDQKALMKEVSRVLKPGGVIVFSDIMQGDGGGDCTSFTGQNVVASMASPQMYKARPQFIATRFIHFYHRVNAHENNQQREVVNLCTAVSTMSHLTGYLVGYHMHLETRYQVCAMTYERYMRHSERLRCLFHGVLRARLWSLS